MSIRILERRSSRFEIRTATTSRSARFDSSGLREADRLDVAQGDGHGTGAFARVARDAREALAHPVPGGRAGPLSRLGDEHDRIEEKVSGLGLELERSVGDPDLAQLGDRLR